MRMPIIDSGFAATNAFGSEQVDQDGSRPRLAVSHTFLSAAPPRGPSKCQNQKIRSRYYYSFNVLGLALVFVAGISVISLRSCAPWIANYNRHKALLGQPVVDEKRHPLQRLSPKREHGIAPWTVTGNIPVPIEHQREFRIPWLTRRHGIRFDLKIEAIRACQRT